MLRTSHTCMKDEHSDSILYFISPSYTKKCYLITQIRPMLLHFSITFDEWQIDTLHFYTEFYLCNPCRRCHGQNTRVQSCTFFIFFFIIPKFHIYYFGICDYFPFSFCTQSLIFINISYTNFFRLYCVADNLFQFSNIFRTINSTMVR